MKFNQKYLVGVIAGSLLSSSAFALTCDKSYGMQVTVGATVGSAVCDSSSTAFIDNLKNFSGLNASYTQTSAATIAGRFNDVNIDLSYAANSNQLNYTFKELGISGSFTGASRDASEEAFKDFVKKNDIIGKIMKYQAQHSATSPISGVGGLIPMTAAADFESTFATASAISGAPSTGAASNNLIGASISYGSYKVDGYGDRVSTMSLPLSYTIRNDIDPRRQLAFSLPITVIDIGGAKTIHTGLGVAYRFPITERWSIAPSARYSIVASKDRATVSTVYSAALSSVYRIPMERFDLAIGNMVGYYRTGKFAAGDYSFDPNIKNVVLRNGVMLSQPVNFGKKMSIEYSLVDTRYMGDKPAVDNTQELSITLGTNKNAFDARSFVRGGVTLMRGPGVNGVTANIGYWF